MVIEGQSRGTSPPEAKGANQPVFELAGSSERHYGVIDLLFVLYLKGVGR
jgi:hypothetical protein